MKTMNVLIAMFIGWPLAPVLAHGDKNHASKQQEVKKEQKAWGIAGDAKSVSRTVELRMSDDMRFTPNSVQVKLGQTVRLKLFNQGKILHELVIGTKQELDEHAALMAKHPGMEHDEPYMAHVTPGKTGEILWRFNRPGEFEFACLIAGHFSAGMKGKISVLAAKK